MSMSAFQVFSVVMFMLLGACQRIEMIEDVSAVDAATLAGTYRYPKTSGGEIALHLHSNGTFDQEIPRVGMKRGTWRLERGGIVFDDFWVSWRNERLAKPDEPNESFTFSWDLARVNGTVVLYGGDSADPDAWHVIEKSE